MLPVDSTSKLGDGWEGGGGDTVGGGGGDTVGGGGGDAGSSSHTRVPCSACFRSTYFEVDKAKEGTTIVS